MQMKSRLRCPPQRLLPLCEYLVDYSWDVVVEMKNQGRDAPCLDCLHGNFAI